ncbi:C40 family peptidase [Streptomyces sp. NPDC048420]|uniref:C40 family peptidase n=1 Tax=Streptomyces sp. NPDC048420 TaxID=3155755 RepID=UPI003428482D
MAPDRTSRNGGFSLPAKRNSALATAAMASAALLSQSGSAAADEGPSRDEVSRRVTNLYDRAESDSGTYNATRAAGRASSTRGRTTGAATGGGGRADRDPALDTLAKQWYGVARAKLGPFVEATLPADRTPARPVENRRPRPAADTRTAREPGPAERAMPELTAKPMLALPAAPETAPAADQTSTWAALEPAPQNVTGTDEIPTVATPQLDTGYREYGTQADTASTGFPEHGGQLGTGFTEYSGQLDTAFPNYTPTADAAQYTGQLRTGLPEFAGELGTGGLPEYTAQVGTGYTAQPSTGFPEYTGQFSTGLPDYTGQFSTGLPDYTAQPTTAFPEYSTQLSPPLAVIAPPPVDTTQSVPMVTQAIPAIPAPRAPEPQWQAPQSTSAPVDPAGSLPTVDPGYDSKVIQVLAFARSQIGKPCVWGAAGPGSYDNAGLTQAAWKVAGVSLPRTSLGQASTGTAVPLYAMQPGDLVFFHDDFSHVGLCTGNGMMIHAPGPGASIREESIYPTGESIIRGAIRPA